MPARSKWARDVLWHRNRRVRLEAPFEGKGTRDEQSRAGVSDQSLYDPKAKQWSLYWANSAKGTLEKPTIGEFKDGRGEFFDHEPFEGRMIFVRYLWSGITPNSCRWEQAFSADGGKTWETNWIMEMTRTSP